jgi:iron complex outermembrane receptor protein
MKKFISFVVVLLCTISSLSYAQFIQLIDKQQNIPVNNATYQYGRQLGISDTNGTITINNDHQSSLTISHLQYGVLVLDAQQMESIFQSGQLTLSKQQFELQPVSIIALHRPTPDSLSISFNNQNRLAHDAADVLSQLPEIALIRKSGNYGFDPVLRGFKYEQLNIVLDGAQSANAACPNRMDTPSSQMPVNMLSQITVLKGPYSLRYGSALGGTINFQTEAPHYTTETVVTGRLSGSYETNGNIYRSEALAGISGKSHDIKLFGSLSDGGNYEDGDGNEVLSSFYRNNFGSLMSFKLSDAQSLRINVNHNYAKDVDFPALPMDLREDDTWLTSLQHSILFDKKLKEWRTNLYATYVDHLMDNYDKIIEPRNVDAVTAAKTYNYGGRTEGHWLYGNNQLYAGMDFRADKAEGERSRHFLMGPNTGNTVYDNVWQDAYINKLAAYAEFQNTYKQWQLTYSARMEYNQADADKPDANFASYYKEMDASTFNTSLSFGVSRQLLANLTGELWIGHAERSGSITERYINFLPVGIDPYEMIGNPELSSEKNNQVDINLKYQNKGTQFQLTGFMSIINDYISSEIREDISPKMPSSPGVRQFINIDQAQLMGFEAVWLQKLPANLQHRLSLAYTYGKNKDTEEALPEIAPMDIRYILTGHYLNNQLRPEISFRHVLKQNRIAESFGETATPSFKLVDVSLNYQINKHLEVNAAVNNLLDETYYEHLTRSVKGTNNAINAPGRSMIITLVGRL